MTVSRSITLSWASSHYIFGEHDGVRLRITVTCAENLDTEIFAYRMMTTDPTTGAKAAFFSHVCSPPDLVEWPKNAIDPMSSPQWLRLPYIDVLVRSVAEAEEFVRLVKEDVFRLKTTLDNMGTLTDTTTITYGLGCTDDDVDPPVTSSSEAAEVYSWSSESEHLDAAAGGLVFAPHSDWVIVAGGPDTAPETPSSLARITLRPGTSSPVLPISGFDVSSLDPLTQITGITATLRLRDATDGEDSLGSIGSNSDGVVNGPQLAALRLYAAGYSSDNLAAGEEIVGPEWDVLQAGDSDDTWGLPRLTIGELQTYGFALIISIYVPFSGRSTIVEVDGASILLHTRTRL